MFGRVNIVYDNHANALQIPRSAIVDDAGDSTVFVVEETTAHRRVVETGYISNGQIEILEGLEDTDQIVLVGQLGLKDGTKVTVINAVDAGDNAVGDTRPSSK